MMPSKTAFLCLPAISWAGFGWTCTCQISSGFRAEITKSALWYLSPHIRYGQSGSVDQCNITRGTYLAIYSEFHGESVVLLPITALLPQKQTKSALWYLTPHIRSDLARVSWWFNIILLEAPSYQSIASSMKNLWCYYLLVVLLPQKQTKSAL